MPETSRRTADSTLVRTLNARRVLAALREHPGALTSGELVTATGLSRPTVHAAAGHLVRLGWAEETAGTGAGSRGRPSRAFAFRADAGHVLGLDVGAHSARAALADLRGRTVASGHRVLAGPGLPAPERVARARELAAATLAEAGVAPEEVLAVCVGSSGTVGADGAVRLRTGIPGFLGLNLRTEFEDGYGGPVLAENDCNLAAVAERWHGVARDAREVVVLLAGERLGAGIVVGGALQRGHAGAAGELGFLRMTGGGASAGQGIATLARRHGARLVAASPSDDQPGFLLAELADGDPERVDARTVFEALRRGDTASGELLDAMLTPVARAVTVMAMLLDPQLVVVSGAVAAAGDVLLEPLRERVGALTRVVPELAFSPLGERAVVTGAVRLALDEVEQRRLEPLVPAPGRSVAG